MVCSPLGHECVINIAILVDNRVRFLHACFELGVFFFLLRRSYFFGQEKGRDWKMGDLVTSRVRLLRNGPHTLHAILL